MVEARLLVSAGRRRSPASMPGYHLGRIPRNKGQRYQEQSGPGLRRGPEARGAA